MIFNDFQRGRLPYFNIPPNCTDNREDKEVGFIRWTFIWLKFDRNKQLLIVLSSVLVSFVRNYIYFEPFQDDDKMPTEMELSFIDKVQATIEEPEEDLSKKPEPETENAEMETSIADITEVASAE